MHTQKISRQTYSSHTMTRSHSSTIFTVYSRSRSSSKPSAQDSGYFRNINFTKCHASISQFIYLASPTTQLYQRNSNHQRVSMTLSILYMQHFSFLFPLFYDDSCSLWLLQRLLVSWNSLAHSKGIINPRNLQVTLPLPLSDPGRLCLLPGMQPQQKSPIRNWKGDERENWLLWFVSRLES